MSKCLYTEAVVTQSGAQLLINAISLDIEKKVSLRNPKSLQFDMIVFCMVYFNEW